MIYYFAPVLLRPFTTTEPAEEATYNISHRYRYTIFYASHCGRRGNAGRMAVVASAMGGKPKVTDLLLNSVSLAAAGNREGSEVLGDCSRAFFSSAGWVLCCWRGRGRGVCVRSRSSLTSLHSCGTVFTHLGQESVFTVGPNFCSKPSGLLSRLKLLQ